MHLSLNSYSLFVKVMKILLFFFLFSIVVACDRVSGIAVENKTDKNLYAYISPSDTMGLFLYSSSCCSWRKYYRNENVVMSSYFGGSIEMLDPYRLVEKRYKGGIRFLNMDKKDLIHSSIDNKVRIYFIEDSILVNYHWKYIVKNILVLRNAFEKTRKKMKANTLSIKRLSDNLNFPMFAELTLKKT